MEKLSGTAALDYHRYEKEFMKLMFPEPPKKSKEQIKSKQKTSLISLDNWNVAAKGRNVSDSSHWSTVIPNERSEMRELVVD